MTIEEGLVTNALLMSTTLLLAAATVAILRFQRMVRRSSHLFTAPGAVPESPPAASESLEQRIRALQEIAEELARKEALQRERPAIPYENAARMARSGAGVDELTRCGLKKGEAELLVRLHAHAAGA